MGRPAATIESFGFVGLTAAGAAAFSGAVEMKAGDDYNTEATAVAGQNGFVNGANGVSFAVHNPPANAADVNSSRR